MEELTSSLGFKLKEFSLPDCLGLCLVDVNSGSDTKVLVKKVLEWEKKNRENEAVMFSSPLFQKLKETIEQVKELLLTRVVSGQEEDPDRGELTAKAVMRKL
eukprot:CAMPEP_0168620644 /NCGR_PEP_ID=MMETSP0449_2-20121227/7256_1 /TAXON_ID=1082188 /ORGANISM="Strombidium rassoulzadegani, Strain ras09" /LENGTH=101 /DNA_ID=CAMNT_0008661681 /DNA_START=827 /DNA_END=1132 /DNA_ORIENTATION=+